MEKDPSARIVEGLRRAFSHAWADPQLRLILSVVTVVSTIGFNFHVLVPLLAADTLHVGPEGFGFLSATFGLGALVGALAAATFRGASWRTSRSAQVRSACSHSPWLRCRTRTSRARSCSASASRSRCSRRTRTRSSSSAAPDYLRGRLIGIYLFAFLGLAPVGGLIAGWLAEVGGTSLAFSVAGATSLAAILVANAWHRALLATGSLERRIGSRVDGVRCLLPRRRVRPDEQLCRDRAGSARARSPRRLRDRGVLRGRPRGAGIRGAPHATRPSTRGRGGGRAVLEGLHPRHRSGVPKAHDRAAHRVHRADVASAVRRRPLRRRPAARDLRRAAAGRDRRGQRRLLPGHPPFRTPVGADRVVQPARGEGRGDPAGLLGLSRE